MIQNDYKENLESSCEPYNEQEVSDEAIATRLQLVFARIGQSASAVGQELGVSASAATKWVRTGRIKRQYLTTIADRYGISIEWLLTGRTEPAEVRFPENFGTGYRQQSAGVPEFTLGSCQYSDQQGLVGREIGSAPVGDRAGLHAIRVDDESMADAVPNGATVLVDSTKVPSPGDLVLVALPTGRCAVRVYSVESIDSDGRERVVYRSEHPNHPSFESPTSGGEVLGAVVEVRLRVG